MNSFGVILDANVLIPAALSDTLLRAAHADLYRVHWSEDILEEVERNLVENGLTSETKARNRIAQMRTAFPEATVTGYEALTDSMMNDPKDRHVLAAAVTAGAQVIVTMNLSDFSEDALAPYHIEAQSSDMFLLNLFGLDSSGMVTIISQQAAILRKPPMTVEEVLSSIALHAPLFAQAVENWMKSS